MLHLLLFLFQMSLCAESVHPVDPIALYQEAMHTDSVQKQSYLLNTALTGFLDQKPQNPSAVWHFDVACCFLALHEAGPAIFHFLEAKRIDPGLIQVAAGLSRARQEAHLPSEMAELRPFWVVPFISKTALEIVFLVACLTAFAVASLGLYLRISALLTAARWISCFSLAIGLLVVLRTLAPLDGVVVYPEKLHRDQSGEPLPRAMMPGEQVQVLDIQGAMLQVATSDRQIGWMSDKTCWILTPN